MKFFLLSRLLSVALVSKFAFGAVAGLRSDDPRSLEDEQFWNRFLEGASFSAPTEVPAKPPITPSVLPPPVAPPIPPPPITPPIPPPVAPPIPPPPITPTIPPPVTATIPPPITPTIPPPVTPPIPPPPITPTIPPPVTPPIPPPITPTIPPPVTPPIPPPPIAPPIPQPVAPPIPPPPIAPPIPPPVSPPIPPPPIAPPIPPPPIAPPIPPPVSPPIPPPPIAPPIPPPPIAPPIPPPTMATPFKTLEFLKSMSGQKTVAGVHNRYNDFPKNFTEQFTEITGKTPGLWSGDFLYEEFNIVSRHKMRDEAKAQWDKERAMINIMWHSCNPALSEPCEYSKCEDGPGAGTGPWSFMPQDQWDELITDGTNLNNIWKKRMDNITEHLQILKDNGVEVMFRPLHEMNQDCFWWGGRAGQNGTSRLYQITHDYLTNQKGLTNLIWVWNLQDFDTLREDVNDYNPGSEYWDIASLDIYDTDGKGYSQEKYEIMVEVAGGKPVAIGEFKKLPTLNDLSSQPKWTFIMSWSEWLVENNTNETIKAFYNSDRVLTLDEMVNWRG